MSGENTLKLDLKPWCWCLVLLLRRWESGFGCSVTVSGRTRAARVVLHLRDGDAQPPPRAAAMRWAIPEQGLAVAVPKTAARGLCVGSGWELGSVCCPLASVSLPQVP